MARNSKRRQLHARIASLVVVGLVAIGAAAGAVIGAATGGGVKGAVVGGAAGAILGGVIGNNVDKKRKKND